MTDLTGATAQTVEQLREALRTESERNRARATLEGAKVRLAQTLRLPVPTVKLLRNRHLQRLSALKRYVRHLEEYLNTELLTGQ